ncbi:Fungalysin metallopeptidase-domain-containing protein [Mycena rebaudengoi]|nr:Fungalysin metallopeptidase-domain-containing protein [Mycena rebaudengoi]
MRNTFFTWALLSVLYVSNVTSAPTPGGSKHATHKKRRLPSGLTLTTYHPASTYETFGNGVDHPLRKRAGATLKEASFAYIQETLNLTKEAVAWQSGFTGTQSRYAYLRQAHNGIPFANCVANVAFNNDDNVVAFGSSFMSHTSYASSTPSFAFNDARAIAEEQLKAYHNDVPAPVLKYFGMEDGSAALVHAFQLKGESGEWLEALVDAHSGNLVSVVDYVSHATYRVVPITKDSPLAGFETLVDPEDAEASPNGWHSIVANKDLTKTMGNNVIVSSKGRKVTLQSAPDLVFDYELDENEEPDVPVNVAAASVNAFYLVNTVHDIAYRYGFTEEAFNFQFLNFDKGGEFADGVTVNVQADGLNNANFASPPDGQLGVMNLFLFDSTDPKRDSALQTDVAVHEAMHGITNRMTGGGTSSCLQTAESSGLGEGWSDALAEWTQQTSADVKDFVLGAYIIDDPLGIRSHPYSTSKKVNPLTYASVAGQEEEHRIGEVWANMLHNVYAALVEELGFSDTAHTNPDGPEGNIVFMHLMIDALALQPCNPTFVTARDAWVQADKNRYDGAHRCTVLKAFASRGLGTNAKLFKDDTSIPNDC